MSISRSHIEVHSRKVKDIDWTDVIENFGHQHEMSWNETLQWISNRSSLQVACEIFNVTLSPTIVSRYTRGDIDILRSLGDLLFSSGYRVPRLMENHRLEYSRKELNHVGFSLSKEEYLRERANGKSKNRIAREQGISGPAIFHWLEKWDLKDSSVEQREIGRIAKERTSVNKSTLPFRVPAEQMMIVPVAKDGEADKHETRDANTIQSEGTQSVGTFHVTLPLIVSSLPPVGINQHGEKPIGSRDDVMQSALTLLQCAVGQAYVDLAEMLGKEAATQQVQQYVNHQLQRFLQKQ